MYEVRLALHSGCIPVILFLVGRRVVVNLSITKAISSSFTAGESGQKLIEAAGSSNSSHTTIGKGWGNKGARLNKYFWVFTWRSQGVGGLT